MLCLALLSCQEHEPNSNVGLSLEYYKEMRNPNYAINSQVIRELMDSLMRNDGGTTVADQHTKRYYRKKGGFLWIDRHGVDHRADTLLAYLQRVGDMGFNPQHFYVKNIENDLQRLRDLQLGEGMEDINHVLARLEYRLTRSYLRYAGGQRFGYVNPTFVLNRLDSIDSNPYDSIKRPVRYRGLYDVKIDHANDHFYLLALQQIAKSGKSDGAGDNQNAASNSLTAFLHDVQPKSAFYEQLAKKLQTPGLDKAMRIKILVNMERCRWRQADSPEKHQKYVLVNIPSYHLYAIDHQDTLSMRIGCGSTKTKTPLLTSYFKRMDLNPKWFVPRSIMLKDMAHHAGNVGYFKSRNYYISDRSTGKEVDPARVTRSMLVSGKYGVVQRGGKGNALGRIIFRFDNNFSVYLHDTSSRSVFEKEDRGVSHGCVRVEKPFELAKFLLKEKNPKLLQRIEYSMTADSLNIRSKVVGSVKVDPQVPLFITYYTLYPLAGGMANYPDVYGFDEVIYNLLKKYL